MIRLNGDIPIKYGLRLNSEAKYSELKQQLYTLCDILPDRLLLAEVAYSQIKQTLSDDSRIIQGSAMEIYAYELPGAGRDDHHLARIDDETGACVGSRPR